MKYFLLSYKYIILGLLSIVLAYVYVNGLWIREPFVTIPVHEMIMEFQSQPTKSIAEKSSSQFSTTVNGSYFGQSSTGSYFPAGLWQEDGNTLSEINFTDPNLSEVVTYLHSENIIATRRNTDYDSTSCTNGCVAFQAGPLIASEGILLGDYGNSWHANEKHERTILGIFHSRTPIIFVFTEKVTLLEAGGEILAKYPEIKTLVNLDGGPSTAFKTPSVQFREEKVLPIVWHVR